MMILSFPLLVSAQSHNANAYTVSVHELSVPRKALDAFNKGIRRLAASDPNGSIPEFQRAIEEFPGYYEAYDKMGIAELELKRDKDAELAFRKSIDLSDGNYAEPQFALGVILGGDYQRYAEAQTVIQAGLAVDPSSAAGYYSMGWLLYLTNRYAEAERNALMAAVYAPKAPVIRVLLAEIHIRQGNRSALAEDVDAYLKLDPNGPFSGEAKAIQAGAQLFVSRESPLPKLNP